MASQTVRDLTQDHLLTPANAPLPIIDYQPIQVSLIMSMGRELLAENIVQVAKSGKTYGLPTVRLTVCVKTGKNKPLISRLHHVLPGIEPPDRTSVFAGMNGSGTPGVMPRCRVGL
jgi:hypothetical protein